VESRVFISGYAAEMNDALLHTRHEKLK